MLTYKTHLNKQKYVDWINDNSPAYIEMAHETGKDGYEHTHVLLDFTYKFETENPRKFDYKGIHPNIQTLKTKKHWENSLAYLAKEDPDNDHLLKQSTNIIERIWQSQTIQDAISNYTVSLNDVHGIIAAFNNRPIEEIEIPPLLYDWQRRLKEEIFKDNTKRIITWIWDSVGNTGKSLFTAHMMDSFPNDVYSITNFGGARNCATIMDNAKNSGWNGRVLIADLSRSHEDREIYDPLEQVSNGRITVTKYQGKTIRWNPGKIIVFANFPPKVKAMSLDRWDIREIVKDEGRLTLEKRPYTEYLDNNADFD